MTITETERNENKYMKLQKLLSLTRKAVDEFRLIDPGDKIAVGVSGGKDSLNSSTAFRVRLSNF